MESAAPTSGMAASAGPQTLSVSLSRSLGRAIFAARWLMAPIYVGLLIGLVLLVIKFLQILWRLLPGLLDMSGHDLVLAVLGLVDLSLVANLVLIVALAGWQGFVDPMLHIEDRPGWLALDFSAIKLKLIGSIAAIAAIAVLEALLHADALPPATIAWQLAVLLAIGLVGVLMAAMDRLSHQAHKD